MGTLSQKLEVAFAVEDLPSIDLRFNPSGWREGGGRRDGSEEKNKGRKEKGMKEEVAVRFCHLVTRVT